MKTLTLEDYQKAGEEFWPKYWYVAQATQSLGISMEEVLDTNIRKLSKRYPEGTFDSYYSENRAANDR